MEVTVDSAKKSRGIIPGLMYCHYAPHIPAAKIIYNSGIFRTVALFFKVLVVFVLFLLFFISG
jgi:hypothetical protein